MATSSYEVLRRENARYVAMINDAWGASVAWLEDREVGFGNNKSVCPIIVSKMVRGLIPGLTPPPFKDRIESQRQPKAA